MSLLASSIRFTAYLLLLECFSLIRKTSYVAPEITIQLALPPLRKPMSPYAAVGVPCLLRGLAGSGTDLLASALEAKPRWTWIQREAATNKSYGEGLRTPGTLPEIDGDRLKSRRE